MLGIRSFHWPTSSSVHGKNKEVQRSKRRVSSVHHEPMLRPVNEALGRSLEFDLHKHIDGGKNILRRSRSFSTCSYTPSKSFRYTDDDNRQRKPRSLSTYSISQGKNMESDLHKNYPDRSRDSSSLSTCSYEESRKVRSSYTDTNQRIHNEDGKYVMCKVHSCQYLSRTDASTRKISSSSEENHVTRKLRAKSFEEARQPLSRQKSHVCVVQADVHATTSSPISYQGKSKVGKTEHTSPVKGIQAAKMQIPTITTTDYDRECSKCGADACSCQESSSSKPFYETCPDTADNVLFSQEDSSLTSLGKTCKATDSNLKPNEHQSSPSWLRRKIVNKCLKMRKKSIS